MRLLAPCLIVLVAILLLSGCTGTEEKVELKVIPAGSLLEPFEVLEAEFEALHPGVDVQLEGHGSIQVVRQVTDLHREVDVVAVADESLIPDMMYIPMEYGEGNYTDWYIPFATNRIVVAYTNASRYADEINAENWQEILMRPDVRVGFSNPMLDAAGYRTFMVCILAEDYYGDDRIFDAIIGDNLKDPVTIAEEEGMTVVTLPELVRPSNEKLAIRDGSIYLLSLLDAGGIDYAFEYLSVSKMHGLQWIELPPEIDLGYREYEVNYESVKVVLGFERFKSVGNERVGRRIVYGITIPKNAPHPDLAREFVDYTVEECRKGRPGWPQPYT